MVSVMNRIELRKAAENLEDILKNEETIPPSLKRLVDALRPIINRAKSMEISAPIDENEIPGFYQYNEGMMRDFRKFEHAYAEFRIQLSGGLSSNVKNLINSMNNGLSA